MAISSRLLVVLAGVALLSMPGEAQAARRLLAARQAAAAAPAEAMPAPIAPANGCGTCCPQPCISYFDHSCRNVCCDPCLPNINMNVEVCDPCTGCPVIVPICVPGCCTDAPSISKRCTLFGHGAITYCWSSGFSATFRFTKHGDVKVIYRS